MRIVNAMIIGIFFAILPLPILLQAAAAECSYPEFNCARTCALPTLDQTIACSASCNAQYQAAMAQYNQCVQRPSEPNLPPPSLPPRSFSSSSSLKPKQAPTLKTTIYKFGDLKEGDKVTTGKGERATITLDARGSRVGLEPNSTFLFVKPDDYQILKGIFTFFFEKKRELDTNTPLFRVRTPTAVAAVRGTEFLTSVTKTKTVVQVRDGLVTVSNLQGTKSVDVSAGYQTTVTKTKLQAPKLFTEKQLIIHQ